MDRQRFLIPMLALLTVWRLALLPTVELCPDESLALVYAGHPAAWHAEMGPLVPWLVRLSTALFGATEFGVRVLAPMMAFAAGLCVWRMCRGMFGDTAAAWAVMLVQVLPAFNLASVSMTSAIAGMTAVAGFIVAMRAAMLQAARWNRWWVISAVSLLAAMLADWRNGLAFFAAIAALGMSRRRRHHLVSPGFAVIGLGFVVAIAMFVTWNARLHWPLLEIGEAEPVWQVWPNAWRWVLLVSPVLLAGIGWALRQCWRERSQLPHDVPVLLVFAAAYAVLDFGWGPRERWPHAGFPIWMLCGMALLAHYNLGRMPLSVGRKVTLRTVAVLLAATQSMVLLRTDLVRVFGMNWHYQTQYHPGRIYQELVRADPSSAMEGWTRTTSVLDAVIASTRRSDPQPWFIIAPNWPLAVQVNAYLPGDVALLQPTPDHPRVYALLTQERNHPLALLPRYDARVAGVCPFAGQHALFITDSASSSAPPPEIRRAFASWEPVSVVRVMHGGHEVRTVKIFACHGYKPPDV